MRLSEIMMLKATVLPSSMRISESALLQRGRGRGGPLARGTGLVIQSEYQRGKNVSEMYVRMRQRMKERKEVVSTALKGTFWW